MTVPDVAVRLVTTPRTVYQAYRMLVPATPTRRGEQSVVERVLTESSLSLRALEKKGWSHEAIAKELGTSQNIVSACLRVLVQRDDALPRISPAGIEDAVRQLQAAELRIRREAGLGLSVADVIELSGPQILQMRASGAPLWVVANELGLCRETVRRACKEMTGSRYGRELTQNEMESAA
jgi:IS30 family transposase